MNRDKILEKYRLFVIEEAIGKGCKYGPVTPFLRIKIHFYRFLLHLLS